MRALAIFIAVILAIPVLYMFRYQGAWVPFRLTIEVETPEGLKTGSGIWAATTWQQPNLLVNRTGGGDGEGEAFPVDLGPRGTMYVLYAARLNGGPNWLAPMNMLVDSLKASDAPDRPKSAYDYRRLEGSGEVYVLDIPFLVRFRDETNPRTVEAVDPENLAASFGSGVYLKRVTVEVLPKGWWPFNKWGITGTPLTRGIEKRLPWLESLHGNALDGTSGDLGNRLNILQFKTLGT